MKKSSKIKTLPTFPIVRYARMSGSRHRVGKKSKIILTGLILVLFLSFTPQTAKAAVSTGAVLSLTNSARAQNGLAPLASNSQLVQAAALKAQDMLAKDYFAHTSPQGLNSWHWFKQAGYNYKTAGENLAIDFSDSNAVFSAWMASPSHRANILDPDFTEIGIAIVSGEFSGSATTMVVQMFGAKDGQKVASQKSENSNLSWDSEYLKKALQSQGLDSSVFWDKFFEKFKSFFVDTSVNLRKMFVQEVFLV